MTDSAYIGHIGALIPVVQTRGSTSLDAERQTTEHRLLSGAIRIQVAPTTNHKWSCSVPLSHPQDHAGLKALIYAQPTNPPLFIPVDAPTSNVLTPARSQPGEFSGWAGDGAPVDGVVVPGVGLVRGVRSAGGVVTLGGFSTPVVPGKPVTGSVYLGRVAAGSATITVTVFNAAGSALTLRSSQVTVGPEMTRGNVTIDQVPAGAAYVQVRVSGANTIACPAVTWTDKLLPWVPGLMALRVFVGGWSADLKVLDSNTREPVESISFDVTEVG